ncbi:MAG: hypothetical protein OXF01_02170, partial [Gemmatimonadetes bacterium]|nr:hypothetical protein [Gemmatimonadota bacterium]
MANIVGTDRVETTRLGAMVGSPRRNRAPAAGVLLLISLLAAACTDEGSDTAIADLLIDPFHPEWIRPSP